MPSYTPITNSIHGTSAGIPVEYLGLLTIIYVIQWDHGITAARMLVSCSSYHVFVCASRLAFFEREPGNVMGSKNDQHHVDKTTHGVSIDFDLKIWDCNHISLRDKRIGEMGWGMSSFFFFFLTSFKVYSQVIQIDVTYVFPQESTE